MNDDLFNELNFLVWEETWEKLPYHEGVTVPNSIKKMRKGSLAQVIGLFFNSKSLVKGNLVVLRDMARAASPFVVWYVRKYGELEYVALIELMKDYSEVVKEPVMGMIEDLMEGKDENGMASFGSNLKKIINPDL